MSLAILCSKQMVNDSTTASSERVGGPDAFLEGEILVKSNLVDLEE